MRIAFVLVTTLLLSAPPLHAGRASAKPKTGRIVEVGCLAAADQQYAVYLPQKYDEARAYPILYCFAPDGNGGALVEAFQAAAEERGWIVAGSLVSKNGPSEPNDRAWREMLRDTEDRFRLHAKLRVACGFSGGAWVASRMAYGRPDRFAGVIVIGQGLDPTITVDPEMAIVMTMGETERRIHELHDTEALTQRRSPPIPGLFETQPGGHGLPDEAWLGRALAWHRDTWNHRFEGCDDESTGRRQRALTRRLEKARTLEAEGKLPHALRELREIHEGFRNMPVATRTDLAKRIAALEAAPEVETEAQARKALLKLVARDRKTNGKQAHSLVPRYEKLAATYPDTPSAEVALERAATLQ